MRIDVMKCLTYGPRSRKDEFFSKLQHLGCVQVVAPRFESKECPLEVQTYLEALHVLRSMVPVKQVKAHDWRSPIVLARHIVEQNEGLERSLEKRRVIQKEISQVEIFGEFSLPDLYAVEKLSGRTIQFFFAKKIEEIEAIKREEVIYIGMNNGIHYFISINKEPTFYDGLIEMKIEQSLAELREEMAAVMRQIDEYHDELAELSHHMKELKRGLAEALNRHHLNQAKSRVDLYLEGDLFAAQTWIPKNKIPLVNKIADECHVSIELIAHEKKDRIPTYLENKGAGRLGEDLVNIYDTPSKTDRDPSLWVFFSFVIFFSMIIADAGYGMMLFLGGLYLNYKFGKVGGLTQRVIKLMIYLSMGCIVWGIMIPSFVGIEFAPDSKWRDVSLITWMVKKKAEYVMDHQNSIDYKEWIKRYPQLETAKTPLEFVSMVKVEKEKKVVYPIFHDFENNVLIELAIFIGTLHLIISFLRYMDRNWAAIGWVTFMVGAYLYFPSVVKALSLIHYIFEIPPASGAQIGYVMIWVGLGLVFVLGIVQKRLGGLGEVMHVIAVFADVMSYLRIYALSLAGLIMASTFDEIGMSMPIYLGIFVILIGHTINLTLAIMGGVIHGLRLNFIEWYHYSFDGGGWDFKPLSLLKVDEF